MDDDEIDIEGDDDDMGIGNDRSSIPHHVHTPSDSFLSELPETSSWILDSFGDWNVDDDHKSKEFHNMLQEEEYYFNNRQIDAPTGRHHLSPAKHSHSHSHHTLVHNHSLLPDNSPEKSENPKKKIRRKILESDEDEGEAAKKNEPCKKVKTTWTVEEERLFREAINKFGRDYRKVQGHVGTRTIAQVRSHAQKYFQKQKHSSSNTANDPLGNNDNNDTTTKNIRSHNIEGETKKSGNGKHLPSHNTPWTPEEQKAFADGVAMYGKGNWKMISSHIGSRTSLQVKNHARQYFKKMEKLGVDVDIEPKAKVIVEKRKKVEPEQLIQSQVEVIRPQIVKKEYHQEEEDEEIDILGEEGNDSSAKSSSKQIKLETVNPVPSLSVAPANKPTPSIPKPDNSSVTLNSDTIPIKTLTNFNNTMTNNNSTQPFSPNIIEGNEHNNINNNTNTDSNQPQCIKCSNICNNCSSSNINNNNMHNNNNNNNNASGINDGGSEFTEECEEEGGFETHIDCPTPTEEKVYELDAVASDETTGNKEFFCGNSAKTPERYLKIRNTIVDQWLKHKPKYLSKTSVRTGLKDCGDVNAIGRVHDFLERTGAINFGADRPPRHRHTRQPIPTVPSSSSSSSSSVSSTVTSSASSSSSSQAIPHVHLCQSCLAGEADELAYGPRKRRVRNRTGDWIYDDDQNVTYEHRPGSEDGHEEYEQRFAAQNAKYFVEEDDSKKRLPRKRTKFHTASDTTDEGPLPYDPFRLIPCAKSLPPIVAPDAPTTPTSHSTLFTLSIQSNALVIMDTHAHMATTEVLGLLGGTFDEKTRHLHISYAVPCESMSSTVQCEMDPQSQVVAREALSARGMLVVGWYHSHPAFAPCPSVRDIETQSLYQRVCNSPFVGIIVSPYDPQHPSEVSNFNYIVVGDEWSLNHEYQLPYEVPRTIIGDVPTPALFQQISEIINKYRNYKYRVDLNKMFRRSDRTTCLDKMLKSITAHYFVSQGVSGDEQTLLVSKIRTLIMRNERHDKKEQEKDKDKEKEKDKETEKSPEKHDSEKCTTVKRKKDLLQLHQQQQRMLQQQQQEKEERKKENSSPQLIQPQSLQQIAHQKLNNNNNNSEIKPPIKIQQKQSKLSHFSHSPNISPTPSPSLSPVAPSLFPSTSH